MIECQCCPGGNTGSIHCAEQCSSKVVQQTQQCGYKRHGMQLQTGSTPAPIQSRKNLARCRALKTVSSPHLRKSSMLKQQPVSMGHPGDLQDLPSPHEEQGLLCMMHVTAQTLASGQFRQQVSQLARLGHSHVNACLQGNLAGDNPGDAPTPELIRALGVLYDELSITNPRVVAVPLLKLADWDDGAIKSNFSGMSTLAYPGVDAAQQQPDTPGPTTDHAQTHDNEHILLPLVIPPGNPDQPQSQSCPLLFDHVAVGGTFDRLHCGHELLLATTALVARSTVYIGITADLLLANKNHRELLQPYEQRRDAAVKFMQSVRPSLDIEGGALCDPQEPTQAELDPDMQALVVSQETLPGAIKINQGRLARGLTPLLILVVPVIGTNTQSGHKLSSTQLRAQDAALAVAAQHAPV